VGLLNANGYYDPLLALFDKAVEEGFLNVSGRSILVSAPTATELIDKMEVRLQNHHDCCKTSCTGRDLAAANNSGAVGAASAAPATTTTTTTTTGLASSFSSSTSSSSISPTALLQK
jgi:hypothetical protein